MAVSSLRNEEIRQLEQVRQRLIQLSTALQTLQTNLIQSDPLPAWSSFQSQVKIVSQHIDSLSTTLNDNQELFSRLAVFPLPEFPGRAQEGLLGQLLRKKYEPSVEDWIEEGLSSGNTAAALDGSAEADKNQELERLWDWAAVALQDELRRYLPVFGGNYTLEERALGIENVVTGLNRTLPDTMADSDNEDDESDEDEMKDDIKPMPTTKGSVAAEKQETLPPAMSVNDQLKYMVSGILPGPGVAG